MEILRLLKLENTPHALRAEVDKIEYVNDFLYFVIKPLEGNKHIYCSGVNVTKFSPITKGRHRLGQNPAIRGLQTLNNDIRAIVIEKGGKPETIKNPFCQQIHPLEEDLWYKESFLIHNYFLEIGEQIIKFAPSELLRKMFRAMLINEDIPNLPPQEFQNYLYNLAAKL